MLWHSYHWEINYDVFVYYVYEFDGLNRSIIETRMGQY